MKHLDVSITIRPIPTPRRQLPRYAVVMTVGGATAHHLGSRTVLQLWEQDVRAKRLTLVQRPDLRQCHGTRAHEAVIAAPVHLAELVAMQQRFAAIMSRVHRMDTTSDLIGFRSQCRAIRKLDSAPVPMAWVFRSHDLLRRGLEQDLDLPEYRRAKSISLQKMRAIRFYFPQLGL